MKEGGQRQLGRPRKRRNFNTTINLGNVLTGLGLYWVPGRAGVRDNEIADELARDGSALKFVGPEPVLGVSRQDTRRRIRS